MKKLLIRLLVFGVIIAAVCAAIYFIIPTNKYTYLAGLNDKHERLEKLGSPKMVLVGGSNVAFSVQSSMLEEAFGLPVVNMSMHGSLRYEFMINEVKDHIGDGDVVIIFPEYSQMFEPLSTGNPIIYQALEVFPEGINYIESQGKAKIMANTFVEVLQIKVQRVLFSLVDPSRMDTTYNRRVFDKYGDIWIEDTKTSKKNLKGDPMSKNLGRKVSPIFTRMTNEFSAMCRERGATVYFGFPAIAESKFDKRVARTTEKYVREKVDIILFNDPLEYIFPDSLFWDTKYHTTQKGRVIRTEMIIEDLKPYLAQ